MSETPEITVEPKKKAGWQKQDRIQNKVPVALRRIKVMELAIKRTGVRKSAQLLGVSHHTVGQDMRHILKLSEAEAKEKGHELRAVMVEDYKLLRLEVFKRLDLLNAELTAVDERTGLTVQDPDAIDKFAKLSAIWCSIVRTVSPAVGMNLPEKVEVGGDSAWIHELHIKGPQTYQQIAAMTAHAHAEKAG